ncbi:MAG: hypothetical protein KDD11_09975 [Acidobacteria bacterium]|nr:hypothetical protein [Acidobacteriota bacterium]
MTTTFQPTQVTYQIDPAGAAVVSSLASSEPWGPGQGYPYTWDRFVTPAGQPSGTWRSSRFNWRTGGVVLQLGTNGNFGSSVTSQAGWVRRHFGLDSGIHDFKVTFRMGPVTELPNGQVARAQVFARLVPNIPYVAETFVAGNLPAGGVVQLDLRTAIPGPNYDLYVGCSTLIQNPQQNPYCEVIVDDIKVQHTFSPYPYLTDGEPAKAAARQPLKPLETPAGVELPELDQGLRFDLSDLEVTALGGEPATEWIGLSE